MPYQTGSTTSYGFLANHHRTDKLARCRELFLVTASALAGARLGIAVMLPSALPSLARAWRGWPRRYY